MSAHLWRDPGCATIVDITRDEFRAPIARRGQRLPSGQGEVDSGPDWTCMTSA